MYIIMSDLVPNKENKENLWRVSILTVVLSSLKLCSGLYPKPISKPPLLDWARENGWMFHYSSWKWAHPHYFYGISLISRTLYRWISSQNTLHGQKLSNYQFSQHGSPHVMIIFCWNIQHPPKCTHIICSISCVFV